MAILIEMCKGFEWDEGNLDKNWIRHQVSKHECDVAFFNLPILISQDIKHSGQENRYYTLGQTDTKRNLFISFAVRGSKIRVISARDMSKKERRAYEQKTKRNTTV